MSDIRDAESREAALHHELLSLMKDLREQVVDSPFLDKVKNGELSAEQWQAFATQRYLAANNFETLLEAGINTAHENGDQKLANTLQLNLNDETGVSPEGVVDPALAHTKWREDFYGAMGIDEEQLGRTQPMDSTKTYAKEVEKLSKEDLLKIVGAILFLEFSIPKEFGKIREGRDKTFPEKFIDAPGDNDVILEEKRRARLYLDDHIEHDAQSHYPDLLEAIKPYLVNPDKLAQIKEGVKRIAEVKKAFYAGLEEI